MDKKQKILDIMSTKKSGSREHTKLVKRLIKAMYQEQRARETRTRPYSLSLSKVLKNRLLGLISKKK